MSGSDKITFKQLHKLLLKVSSLGDVGLGVNCSCSSISSFYKVINYARSDANPSLEAHSN